jgi:murein L,D-transpeptidase YafK
MAVLTFFIVTFLAVVGLYLHSPAGRAVLDRIEINAIREEHLLRYQFGAPLRGTPRLGTLDARLQHQGLTLGTPAFIRIFKLESELELWLEKDGRFARFATYPICNWSGRLGPKLAEGDLQAPEGFYTVTKEQLNPDSCCDKAFNLGYPNAYDEGLRRTGSFIMIHGGCSSIGCFAMTDPVIEELWRIVTAALDSGEPSVPVHVFPFRMTDANIAVRRSYGWNPFWKDLQAGYGAFETAGVPPVVSVCNGRYVIESGKGKSPGQPVETRCPGAISAAP